MSRTKIKQLGANRQEIHLSDERTILFVSYETVVAGRVPILDKESEKRSQDFFDKLLPLVG